MIDDVQRLVILSLATQIIPVLSIGAPQLQPDEEAASMFRAESRNISKQETYLLFSRF